MVYADSTEVQSLTGKITIKNSTGSNIITSVITDSIERGDSRVKLETGVDIWEITDALYGSVKQASEYFAAAYILQRYADSDGDNKQATLYYQMALDICASIAKSSTQSVVVSSRDYLSYPLNPQGTIHRSLPGTDQVNTLED